jgi:hypothetical protein
MVRDRSVPKLLKQEWLILQQDNLMQPGIRPKEKRWRRLQKDIREVLRAKKEHENEN